MEITYDLICNKLGFDPLNADPKTIYSYQDSSWLIDDSSPSPFSILSEEELDFLLKIFEENKVA